MSTGANVFGELFQALDSKVNWLNEPETGGVAVVDYNSYNILELNSAVTITLEDAASIPVGVKVLIIAQAAVTVNSESLSDGGFAEFTVTKNASGDHQWVITSSNTLATFADDAALSFGTGDDAEILWSTGDADNHTLVIALGNDNQTLHLTDKGAKSTDWAIAAFTHPTYVIHSNTTPATDYLAIGNHDGTVASVDVVGGTTFDIRIAGSDVIQVTATGVTLAIAAAGLLGQGSNVAPLHPTAAPQALSGAGAINVTTYRTNWTTTAADAGTLADGAHVGQLKKIVLVADGGDGTLTPTNLAGGTTITFSAVGDTAVLKWGGTEWTAIELYNDAAGTVATPVLA